MLPIDPHVCPRKRDALFTLEDPYSPWSSHVRFANEFNPRATPLHFLSPRNWFVSRRGWFCLQRSREAKVDYRIYGQRGWKKSGPFDAKWILEEASGKRAPLPFFQLLSLAPSVTSSQLAVWFRRVSALLPFKPLCMSTVTRETAPPSPSLPLELVSFNNHHHHQRRYEGKRLGDFPQSLCASDAFSSGDLSAKISDPFSLSLSPFVEAWSKDLIKILPVKRISCTLFQSIFSLFPCPSYERSPFYLNRGKGGEY